MLTCHTLGGELQVQHTGNLTDTGLSFGARYKNPNFALACTFSPVMLAVRSKVLMFKTHTRTQVSYFHHLNKHRVLLGTELVVPFSPMLGAPTTTFGFQYNFRASKLHGQVNLAVS